MFREYIKYTFQFLVDAVLHKVNFILCWNMIIQNNDMVWIYMYIYSLSLFIKNSNLVYTNKPFVSNLICYCEFTKYLFYDNHFGSDNISALR
jgi:hypothetical protein